MRIEPIVSPGQQACAMALLEEGFGGGESFWRTAFGAPPGKLGHGLLLETKERSAVGVMLLFENERVWAGLRRRVVNLSSWFIRPDYRAHALDMVCEVTADTGAVYTNFSPSGPVQKLMTALGFRYAWRGSYVTVPLLNGLMAGADVALGDSGSEHMPPELALIAGGTGVPPDRYIWVKAQVHDETAVAAFRVIYRRGCRVGRLAYCSNHAVLRRALPSLHWHLLWRSRVVALVLPMLPAYEGLTSLRRPPYGPPTMVRGDISDGQVDTLQSESHYLSLNN